MVFVPLSVCLQFLPSNCVSLARLSIFTYYIAGLLLFDWTMAHTLFTSFHFNDDSDPLLCYGREETLATNKYSMEDYDFLYSICGSDFFQNHKPNDFAVEPIFEDIQSQVSQLGEPDRDKASPFSSPSLELLANFNKPRGAEAASGDYGVVARKLTTDEILRVAGERLIQFSTNKEDGISMSIHPYANSLSGLSIDQTRDVELVYKLLLAAKNVSCQNFDFATKMITNCLRMASNSGTPVQRLVYYFAIALQEKVCRETGITVNERITQPVNSSKRSLGLETNSTFLASHQELPFTQVMQFAGIQSIIENVSTATKIHLIDLQIRSGVQWTALMQGLAEPNEHPITCLKITAVGTNDQLYIEETGKRLTSFAESLNLPFLFHALYVTDMREFKEDLLNIESGETVVVYSFLLLRTMVSRPDCIENVMRAIRRLKPVLMVVVEVEANHNSPTFLDRFIEVFLSYSSYFDCLEDCMEQSSQYRMNLEGVYFGEGIVNIVATEGHERTCRNVKAHVWRAFFARFGMIEVELSESSWYQANLVLKQFVHGSSCNLEPNGKGMVIGWKGTPFHSLTTWKFS